MINTYEVKFYFFNKENKIVPFEYRDYLKSFLHENLLGKNNKLHDIPSDYSISPLFNSNKTIKNIGRIYEKGAIWYIRTCNSKLFEIIYKNGNKSLNKPLFKESGLHLKNIDFKILNVPNQEHMTFGVSPVYLGKYQNNKIDHITYKHGDELTSSLMKKIFLGKTKFLNYNIKPEDFNIKFDFDKKLITEDKKINGISNISTKGNIIINGNSEIYKLFLGLGVGLSTGCGMGYLFYHEKKYI